jgi:hypothetical protein
MPTTPSLAASPSRRHARPRAHRRRRWGAIRFADTGDPTLEFSAATVPTDPIEGFQASDILQIDNFA